MRILVTGGAGFIGSHTTDRLIEQGHDVIVLDAITAPVHRDGKPSYLTPGVELFIGDVRNRDLLANRFAPVTPSIAWLRTRLPDRLRAVY
jgi:dTDP-L-rhamnose 4-epimerase